MPAITIFVGRLQHACYVNLKTPGHVEPGSVVAELLARDVAKVLPVDRILVFERLMRQIVRDFKEERRVREVEARVDALGESFGELGLREDEVKALEESFGGLGL